MEHSKSELSSECLTAIKSSDVSTDIFDRLDEQQISSSTIISLLAHYQSISDLDDDDETVDNWLDNLTEREHQILKAFEIARGRFEHSH